VVRNLPEVKPGTLPLGVSSTDTPLQGTSTSSIPTAGEGLGHLVSGVGGLRLAKNALSGCARRKLKKARARASEAITGGIQQPGNADAPKQSETSTEILKTPRSEGSTPTKTARPPKIPWDSRGPGTYKEVLTNIKIAIFKEAYPEDKLTKRPEDYPRGTGKGVAWDSFRRTTTPKVLQTGGRCINIYICTDQQSG
jgi:hypothetical protein